MLNFYAILQYQSPLHIPGTNSICVLTYTHTKGKDLIRNSLFSSVLKHTAAAVWNQQQPQLMRHSSQHLQLLSVSHQERLKRILQQNLFFPLSPLTSSPWSLYPRAPVPFFDLLSPTLNHLSLLLAAITVSTSSTRKPHITH